MIPDSAVPYCGPPVVPAELWTRWNFDPIVIAALVGCAVVFGMARHRAPHAGVRQPHCFGGGLAALAIAFLSPLCALSVTLFSARIVHHLVLVGVAAPLLALALTRRGPARPHAHPVLAAAVHAVAFWFWHAPAAYAAAVADTGLYWVMEMTLLGTALWFWSGVLALRSSPPALLALLIGFAAQMGLLGAILVFAPTPLYTPHVGTTAVWGLTSLEDQQLAGMIMWAPGLLPYLAAGIIALVSWEASTHERSVRT